MNRYPLSLLLPILAPGIALAGSQAPAEGPKAAVKDTGGQVEVRFANGSTVLMSLLQDKIEVVTDYGQLAVPPRDIRSIEFGLHLSAATRKRIEAALAQLDSPVYRQRENAVQELVTLGPQSYLALRRAAKDTGGEAAKRVQTALDRIGRKVPARLLPAREEDRIRTTKFTIVGRIVTPAIRARADYFGELELKPSQLVSMRWLQAAGETEVIVDAAKYGSGPDQWLDTGVRVEAHAGLKIVAAGHVDLWPQQPGQYLAGPDGMQGGGGVIVNNGRVVRVAGAQANGGTLMGRIGEAGAPFVVGERCRQTPAQAGKLYLHIVPSPWGNASAGSYTVRISSNASLEEE